MKSMSTAVSAFLMLVATGGQAFAHASNCSYWNGPYCEYAHNIRHHSTYQNPCLSPCGGYYNNSGYYGSGSYYGTGSYYSAYIPTQPASTYYSIPSTSYSYTTPYPSYGIGWGTSTTWPSTSCGVTISVGSCGLYGSGTVYY